MLGNNKRRVKFNFSLSSSGSQRFGIKFYFWRPVQQGANGGRERGRLLIRAQLVSVWVIHRNTHKHTHTHTSRHAHTQTPTPAFVGATKNLIFSHYLCILAKAAGENLLPRTQTQTQTRTRMRKRTRTELDPSCEKPNKAGSPHSFPECVWGCLCLSVCLSGCHTREFNVCVILKQCENCAYAQCCDSTAAPAPPLS